MLPPPPKNYKISSAFSYNFKLALTLDCSFEHPTTIVLKNIEKLPPEMNEAVEIMLELFNDLQRENEEVTIQIKSSGTGDNAPYIV